MKKTFILLLIPSLLLIACGEQSNKNKTDENVKEVVVKKTFTEVFAIFKTASAAVDGAKMGTITHYSDDQQYFRDEEQLKEQIGMFLADQGFKDMIAKSKVADAVSSNQFGGSKELAILVETDGYESALVFFFKEYDGEYALISIQAAG